MNILFIDQFSQPGGAQQCLSELLPEVQSLGWNPLLMVPGDGELVRRCRESGIRVASLPLGVYASGRKTPSDMLHFAFALPRVRSAIRAFIAEHRIDLIFVNGPRALPAVTGRGVPVIFHAHSPVAGRVPRFVAERSVRNAGATVIAVSDFVASRYPGARVIYNGVPDYMGSRRPFGAGAPRIGIVGRIAPEKGHLDFVQIAHAMKGQESNPRFFVYGEPLFSGAGFEREVRAAADGAPIEFCGWKNDAGAVMRALDILMVPSNPSEAATRVVMEAFSAGTPVVAYRSGGIPELIDDGRTGLLVEWPDRDLLRHRILSLLANPGSMKQLSAAGRGEWNRRFRIRRFQMAVCDVIGEVMCNAASGRSPANTTQQSPGNHARMRGETFDREFRFERKVTETHRNI